ncbi:MAG TPA: FprA family A-type flavoprotein [Bacteroidetes bacterium]|nr:FprA family A-type flavoprotein [Bacteroidota bacterium]
MKPLKIKEDIYRLGSVDWDRRIFDALIPLPDGTSYNAYLIRGSEKTVLIDTDDPEFKDEFMSQLEGVEKLDYLISLHAEQDHSGCIPFVLKKYPGVKVVVTPKCKNMEMDLLHIPEERFVTVEDGGTLSLGNKTLKFIHTPWVHWPETMCAYLEEDQILFSCDFFGSHLAVSDLFVTNKERTYDAAKRYYAEIMMPFRKIISKNLQKVLVYDIDMIAPSHGPIYREPDLIIEAHKEWVDTPPKNLVVLPYISMHASTRLMVVRLVESLIKNGVEVEQFNLEVTDLGKLAMMLVDAATIVIASPTVLGGPHPAAVYAAYLVNALRPKTMFVSIMGSYGWADRTVPVISGLIKDMKVEVLDPVLSKGAPTQETFAAVDRLAETIAVKHREAGIVE